MKEVALLGGGGLALELMEYMLDDDIKIAGYFAPQEDTDCSQYIPYLGDERDNYSDKLIYLLASGLISLRRKMINFIESHNLESGQFISRKAHVSPMATFGKGVVITPFASITGNPVIGDHVLMNIYSNISHHAVVGNNIVLGPGSRVNGHCCLGNEVSLGSNACLIPGTNLADGVEIGILSYPRRKVKSNKFVLAPPIKAMDKI
ncbi:hypothetical protein [Anaerovibrio sp. JC8]|uniref:hypothetical protein n=1 Tax=Anaerovibrio sp. JC8 TaxID=1240085 RepID=UPI000A0FDDBD|nr:hypothetical protein [Anaerovibrio sp. JC8]